MAFQRVFNWMELTFVTKGNSKQQKRGRPFKGYLLLNKWMISIFHLTTNVVCAVCAIVCYVYVIVKCLASQCGSISVAFMAIEK